MADDTSSNRSLSGCLTCRGRRKKCDGPTSGSKSSCGECIRLNIQCLGFRAERFEWMKDPSTLKAFTDEIKNWTSNRNNFLASTPLSFEHYFELTNEQEYAPPMRPDIRHQRHSPTSIPVPGWTSSQPSTSTSTEMSSYYGSHPYYTTSLQLPPDMPAQGSQWPHQSPISYVPIQSAGEVIPGVVPHQPGHVPYHLQRYPDQPESIQTTTPTLEPGYPPSSPQSHPSYQYSHPLPDNTPVGLTPLQYVDPTQSPVETQQSVELAYNPHVQYAQSSQYPPQYSLPSEPQPDEPAEDDPHDTPH